jgi:hypothetical protein
MREVRNPQFRGLVLPSRRPPCIVPYERPLGPVDRAIWALVSQPIDTWPTEVQAAAARAVLANGTVPLTAPAH